MSNKVALAPESGPTLIAATRTDGLGGRLLAMANAKTLADSLGCRFGFTWNRRAIADESFHIIDLADRIFSADFIERHWLGEAIRASDFGILDAAALATGGSLGEIAKERKLRGFICDDLAILRNTAQPVGVTLRGFDYSPAVKAAIAAANSSRFTRPMAALHLRSGDVVHGKYRTTMVFAGKVIPSTLARAIVAELSSMGLGTLLIGQHRATLEYLKAETGAMLTSDFGVDAFEDETPRTFFEMALMARCQRIYAGSSIYAEIASLMGDVALMRATVLFDAPRAAGIILDELKARQADYHPREAAFGYQAAFLATEGKVIPGEGRAILEKAYALDPENDVYTVKIAAAYFREHDFASGEAALKSLMTRQFRDRRRIPLLVMGLLSEFVADRYAFARDFELFFAAAEAGCPYAAACSAWILQQTTTGRARALAMADLAVKVSPSDPILSKIRRRILQGKKPRSGLLAKARWRLAWLRALAST